MQAPTSTGPVTSSAFVSAPDRVDGPRDLAALQRDTLAVLRRAPLVFVLLPALLFLPFNLLNELVSSSMGGEDWARGLRTYYRISDWIELGVGTLVAATVLRALLVVGGGRVPGVMEALREGVTFWGQAVRTAFVTGIIVGLGTLLLVVPGLIWGTRYMLSVPAAVIDGVDGGTARARSSELVRTRGALRLFLWGFAATFSWYVLSAVPSSVAMLFLPEVPLGVEAAINAILAGFSNVVGAGLVVAVGILYLELSGRSAVWPAGLELHARDGGRVPGPTSSGETGLVVVGSLAGLAALLILPLVALSLWFAFDPEAAGELIHKSALLQRLLD